MLALPLVISAFWWMAALFTTMGFGLAFTDVLTDALMVEAGRPLGLTGAFQAVQWACITGAAVLIGVVGGHLAHTRELNLAFGISAVFPLVSFAMALFFVHETPAPRDAAAFHATTRAIREALAHRDVWMVAGFLFFYTFSPSFGPAFLYYQADELGFSGLAPATPGGELVAFAMWASWCSTMAHWRTKQISATVATDRPTKTLESQVSKRLIL